MSVAVARLPPRGACVHPCSPPCPALVSAGFHEHRSRCNPNPCFSGVDCMETYEYPGYRCGPCPPGLEGNGTHCADIDEVSRTRAHQRGESESQSRQHGQVSHTRCFPSPYVSLSHPVGTDPPPGCSRQCRTRSEAFLAPRAHSALMPTPASPARSASTRHPASAVSPVPVAIGATPSLAWGLTTQRPASR